MTDPWPEGFQARLERWCVEARSLRTVGAAGVPGAGVPRRSRSSALFAGFRQARPGEPAGSVDARTSARWGRLVVAEHELEEAPDLCLWLDMSASMAPARDSALCVGAALGAAALDQGGAVSVRWWPDGGHGPSARRPSERTGWLDALAAGPVGSESREPCPVSGTGRVVVISDWLFESRPAMPTGTVGVLMRAPLGPDDNRTGRWVDVETGESAHLQLDAARARAWSERTRTRWYRTLDGLFTEEDAQNPFEVGARSVWRLLG